jgi:hypothetical protein
MLHAIAQSPAVHVGTPFALLHASPHPPQCASSTAISVSHPAAAVQSAHPAAHVYWHAPSAQLVATMCAGAVAAQSNAAPHPPQLLRSVFVFVSHPAAAVQSPYPDRHAYWQLELTQPVTLMFGGSVAAQLVLHPPQFAGSLVVFTSQPVVSFTSQSAYPAVHVPMSHAPDAHSPAAFAYRVVQSFPQLPQFVAVVMLVSQPFTAVQSAQPLVHDPSVHTPTLQYAVAFAKSPVQSFPQLPQFTVSVFVFVSQPSRLMFSSALQSPYPSPHVMLHSPPVHSAVP